MRDHWFYIGVAATFVLLVAMLFFSLGCSQVAVPPPGPVAVSGIKEVRPEVHVGSDGLTTEQRNVRDRLTMDNKPGSIKHLYIISAYSGDVLIYSTVRGKVTSSGKRLSPTSVATGWVQTHYQNGTPYGVHSGNRVTVGDREHVTSEMLQDDGTYGHSIDYLFWFSADGRYHQHYTSGGQIVHVSDSPLAVKKIIINLEHKE